MEEFYLKIDGDIVGHGSEADMVNLAAQFDADYELIADADVSQREKEAWEHLEGLMGEA